MQNIMCRTVLNEISITYDIYSFVIRLQSLMTVRSLGSGFKKNQSQVEQDLGFDVAWLPFLYHRLQFFQWWITLSCAELLEVFLSTSVPSQLSVIPPHTLLYGCFFSTLLSFLQWYMAVVCSPCSSWEMESFSGCQGLICGVSIHSLSQQNSDLCLRQEFLLPQKQQAYNGIGIGVNIV